MYDARLATSIDSSTSQWLKVPDIAVMEDSREASRPHPKKSARPLNFFSTGRSLFLRYVKHLLELAVL
jgi:hypothetical protein